MKSTYLKYRFFVTYIQRIVTLVILYTLIQFYPLTSSAQEDQTLKKLDGFDTYMSRILTDWNIAGAGIGVVYKDKLIFAKGYGYRDYEKKLPVTPNTLYQIASNTKLFTAVSVGMLVDQGKLDWDNPIKSYIPPIKFYNNELDNSITIRDMLSHRTGISRHDLIWYKSDFNRKELFEKLKYLEPSQPIRQGFLYNNLMYVAAGQIVEILSSKSWENFVQEKILIPLEMRSTIFTVKEMEKNPDHGIPYNEKRDTTILYRIPIYEDQQAVGPAGCIISNIDDMSKWLIALMNKGRYNNTQVIPESILKATLEPSIAVPNNRNIDKGYKEILNPIYGMGRDIVSYRGHSLTYHGGDLPGFHSQISFMPNEDFGVIVFVIGDQGAPLYNIISYNVYERLLGLDQTPWSDRILKDIKEGKKIGKEGRSKVGSDRVAGTKPSHPLSDYIGEYENPAYGIINIDKIDSTLQFGFHKIKLPLKHYHFDRFDTPDDEQDGLFSLNFITNPQGSIDALKISLDETQTNFNKKADAKLSDPNTLRIYTGKYMIAGSFIYIKFIDNAIYLVSPGQPQYQLIPIKTNTFKIKEFADYRFVFEIVNNKVTGLKQIDPSGEYFIEKIE